jgi:hypothetical protein
MKKNNWIIGIFLSLLFFLWSFFVQGAKNFTEVSSRFNYYLSVNKNNPKFILGSLIGGLFVGIIFWFLRDFGNKKSLSQGEWIFRSIIKLVVLFIFIFLIIRGIDFFVNQGV